MKNRQFVVIYATIAILLSLLLALEDYWEGDYENIDRLILDFVTDAFMGFSLVYVMSAIIISIIRFLNSKLPWNKNIWLRASSELGILALFVAGLSVIFIWISILFDTTRATLPDDGDWWSFKLVTVLMFTMSSSFLFVFHEFVTIIMEKNQLRALNSELEKQTALSKYEVLRNQINPHFLFNSLNVLSTLIYKNVQQADSFIQEFSKVFRYVLELNQEVVVSLEQELKFLDSYLFLQKIRFGENLQVEKKIDSLCLNKLVPPLSLQILLENVIKHNIISSDQPLHIQIKGDQDYIQVVNHYQPRTKPETASTGIGQRNLKEKYELISEEQPIFEIVNDSYIARLPLLEAETI